MLVAGTERWVGQEMAVVGLREVAEATGNWLVRDRTDLTCKESEGDCEKIFWSIQFAVDYIWI